MRRDKEAVAAAQALLGRTEEHPTEGVNWEGMVGIFRRDSREEWEHGESDESERMELQHDDLSGLDVVV